MRLTTVPRSKGPATAGAIATMLRSGRPCRDPRGRALAGDVVGDRPGARGGVDGAHSAGGRAARIGELRRTRFGASRDRALAMPACGQIPTPASLAVRPCGRVLRCGQALGTVCAAELEEQRAVFGRRRWGFRSRRRTGGVWHLASVVGQGPPRRRGGGVKLELGKASLPSGALPGGQRRIWSWPGVQVGGVMKAPRAPPKRCALTS